MYTQKIVMRTTNQNNLEAFSSVPMLNFNPVFLTTILYSQKQCVEFSLLHILVNIWYCQCSGFGHSDSYAVVPHLICICLMIYNVKHLFICIFSSIYDFDEVSTKIFGLFFNWVVWFLLLIFKSSFFIFNKSKQICLLQVFSPFTSIFL